MDERKSDRTTKAVCEDCDHIRCEKCHHDQWPQLADGCCSCLDNLLHQPQREGR